MALSVVMPALEMAQETGKVVAWRKQRGEAVTKGEVLIEIETDKAVVEIEALGDGILDGITAQVGDVVPVGQTIAWLLAPGEAVPAVTAPAQTGRRSDATAVVGQTQSRSTSPQATGSIRISPKARMLAKEQGLELGSLTGSGRDGEILVEDVQKAAAARGGHRQPDEPSTIGRLMAERTLQSWTTVPHFFLARDVDATAITKARESLLAPIEKAHGVRLTHTDLLVAAVARIIRKHPRINASWIDGAVRTNANVNVGLALAVDDGVVAAVIPSADVATVERIALRRRELTERARANKLQPADLTGGTFTLSNLGMYGVDSFTAIIVPPQAAILAVGAVTDRVVAIDHQPAVRPMMTLTLSSDHRVIDGARAAAFMKDLVEMLQTSEGDGAWSLDRKSAARD